MIRKETTVGPCRLLLGDCMEILPTLGKFDAVVTDPPYGCDKAEWDSVFPTNWYEPAKLLCDLICVITGSAGIKDSMKLVGEDYIDTIAARNMNGMTRGPIGFGNWISAVIAIGKPRQGPNAFDFCIRSEMPNHPSPKPIEYMQKLIERVTEENKFILDPFMGSGTTGVACIKTGRQFTGIEIDEKYYDIAVRRCKEAWGDGSLFDDKAVAESQSLFAGAESCSR